MKINYVWSVGQGVKTPPFHGGNAGSNPARIIVISGDDALRGHTRSHSEHDG